MKVCLKLRKIGKAVWHKRERVTTLKWILQGKNLAGSEQEVKMQGIP